MTIFYYEDDPEPRKRKPPKPLSAREVHNDIYSAGSKRPLIEVFVDPGYELETLPPSDVELYNKLLERFYNRLYEPIPYVDLKSALYTIGNKMDKRISDYQILHLLRRLWRAGYIRRFIRGRSKRVSKPGRGEWYGVHYLLKWNENEI